MSQAEIAGGKLISADELPTKGHLLRDFELVSSKGEPIHLSDYRGRLNLVLIVTDQNRDAEELLRESRDHYEEIRRYDAEVLAIMGLSRKQASDEAQRLKLPYPVLPDPEKHVHRLLGAIDAQGRDSAAVYITDRFGEVFGAYRTKDQQALPSLPDILNWLEFVEAQCPECEPPEWPVQ
ncbi:MAG TPA: redoxin domain-containing protein [Terriglobales bacterium]|nr:redoxin domain-containing protein [Terriglobales bacterium]